MPEEKTPERYSKEAEFSDPMLRCDSCAKLVARLSLQELGCCPECGNRRMRNVLAMSESEMDGLINKSIDPAWLKLFQGVEEPCASQ